MSRQTSASTFLQIRSVFFLVIAALLCFAGNRVSAQTTNRVMTNAADILSLPEQLARQKIPVRVRGIVTAAEPGWGGQFFVQDATAGIFVENRSDEYPKPGDEVEIKGMTEPGAFAPIISKPTWITLSHGPLPKARPVLLDQLMSGAEDGQRVEITGVVRAVTSLATALDIEVASGGDRIHVFRKRTPDIDPTSLIESRVRVRGTVAASFNKAVRHLMYVVMFVPQSSDFVIEQMQSTDPFSKPILPLSGIAEYRRDIMPGQRVHVKGVVTLQRLGEDLFLQDASGGLHIECNQTEKFAVGDVVDVVGFPDIDHLLPVLHDALVRKTSEKWPLSKLKVTSLRDNVPEANRDRLITNHAALVTMPGKLLQRTARNSRSGPVVFLMLQAENLGLTVEVEVPDLNVMSIPIGSTVEATGVCFTRFTRNDARLTRNDEFNKLESMQLFLADSSYIRILQKPSWFTPARLLIGLGILFVVLVVAVSWSVTVSKKNSVLRRAQLALQEGHDQLEERVKERTAQLKFQITARKESELQFKGILRERTRLAQELHDTVEQTLTGIALQLDTTSKLFAARPEGASRHLELARNLVSQSQVDVRRSVWDLRSRALEEFDLPGALATSGKQLVDGTNVNLEVTSKGRVRPLSETVEENLLRIAQESLTNVIKHAGATDVKIELDYGPQTVTLTVQDNGHGFEPDKSAGPDQGHFGLLGISERTKRLGAELAVESEPGRGTTVRIKVPIDQNTPSPDFAASEAVL
jgi:signal transduction histidine kinase